ncbi:hypothetical protein GMORB2_3177 [Geosmithia morbida]|uniref:Uncharacterized protein n=1 Tax=Geosmithia morbida TaxID=1094350 RepID=A0A9P5D1E5_9HYPO|nr:uncharacterized protein GMORB2_3177 [Geosmithia morbida]KAF4120376.1 hypothetical protein GMORB2_3177 [Geosmithia morbida]
MPVDVNRPTDTKLKEADINRKLQIYGIINAFQHGKAPSNEQIDVALNSFLQSKILGKPHEKLSADGKTLVNDTRDVVEKAKDLLLTKNEGNLLQDFIWQTRGYDYKSVKGPESTLKRDDAKRDGQEALQGLRTLGTLLVTNGQFRKLLKDSTVLLRDVAADGATSAAGRARPKDDALAQLDQAAADNTWHEAPNLSKEAWKAKKDKYYASKPKEDASDVAKDVKSSAANNDSAEKAADDAAKKSKNKFGNRLSPEAQEKLKKRHEEYRQRAKDYYNKKMPAERRDQIVFRLKKMILECQQHPDYSQAIQTLLKLAENYGNHGSAMGKSVGGSAGQARNGFAAAEADLRTLLERSANGTSTSDLWESISQIYKAARKDDELSGWFKNVDTYIRRCLLEDGYVLEKSSKEDGDALYEKGKYLLREKYRSQFDRVVEEVKFLGGQFDKDPQNKAFAVSVQKLFNDLGQGEDGKSAFKPHLVKDLTEVIIPGIFENVAYIPIPRIEYSDPQFDAVIENLVLESDNFAPNVFELASDNHWRWGRKKLGSSNRNMIDIKVSGIQMDLRDVSYHIKRKQGFPSITDTGVFDLILPGNGFSFRIKASTADKKDTQHFFKVDNVDVDFKSLQFKVKQSKYKLLFSLFKPIALRAMRPAIKKAVESAIKDQCNELDAFLHKVKQESDKSTLSDKKDEAPSNKYKRYYETFQKMMTEKKEKAAKEKEGKTSDKKVNIAMTMEDSIFPDVRLPSGISTKATEYKDLARKGDKWESPVFSVGKAQKSSKLPSAPRIERKSRAALGGGASNGASNGARNGGGYTSSLDPGSNGANYINGTANNKYAQDATNGVTNGAKNGASAINAL